MVAWESLSCAGTMKSIPTLAFISFSLSSSPILQERSVKGKERAIDGDMEMADGRDKPAGCVFEMMSMSSVLLPFLSPIFIYRLSNH